MELLIAYPLIHSLLRFLVDIAVNGTNWFKTSIKKKKSYLYLVSVGFFFTVLNVFFNSIFFSNYWNLLSVFLYTSVVGYCEYNLFDKNKECGDKKDPLVIKTISTVSSFLIGIAFYMMKTEEGKKREVARNLDCPQEPDDGLPTFESGFSNC